MVRKFFQFAGLALVFAATATVAHAQSASGGYSGGSGSGSSGAAPEIDPGSIASALTLLCGGVLMMTDKFRGK
jgi:hypothetical protein